MSNNNWIKKKDEHKIYTKNKVGIRCIGIKQDFETKSQPLIRSL